MHWPNSQPDKHFHPRDRDRRLGTASAPHPLPGLRSCTEHLLRV